MKKNSSGWMTNAKLSSDNFRLVRKYQDFEFDGQNYIKNNMVSAQKAYYLGLVTAEALSNLGLNATSSEEILISQIISPEKLFKSQEKFYGYNIVFTKSKMRRYKNIPTEFSLLEGNMKSILASLKIKGASSLGHLIDSRLKEMVNVARYNILELEEVRPVALVFLRLTEGDSFGISVYDYYEIRSIDGSDYHVVDSEGISYNVNIPSCVLKTALIRSLTIFLSSSYKLSR